MKKELLLLLASKEAQTTRQEQPKQTQTTPQEQPEQTQTAASKQSQAKAPGNTVKTAETDENDMTPKDGYLVLKLSSDKIFTNGSVLISGESVNSM